MENIMKNIKDNVKGVCRIEIYDEKGNKVTEQENENTLNNHFIWDLCRQQLFRTNANKRDISPFGGVVLTRTGLEKEPALPCVVGDVAGFASLYRDGRDGANIKEGYSNSALTKCKDGEFTFEFIFGPNKKVDDFDTIWLYSGQRKKSTSESSDGGFYDLVQVETTNFPTGSLGCSTNGSVYALNNYNLRQYQINLSQNGQYKFVLDKEIVTDSYYLTTDQSNTSAFCPKNNCFIIFNGNKIIKLNINGEIETQNNNGHAYAGYSGAVCYGDYVLRMDAGTLKVYNISDLAYVKTIVLNTEYGESSSIYIDSTRNVLFVHNYDLTTMNDETDIYLIDSDLNLYYLNNFKGGTFPKNNGIKEMGCLGTNYFAIENNGLYCNNIFPCTQDVILNGGTGEMLTFNKPYGYSARVIYKIFFTFDDKKEMENNKINPRSFQDMILNMLLPQKRVNDELEETEGLNVFGSFMVLDNGESDDLTDEHTKRTGFSYSYAQKKSLNYPTLQGTSDITAYSINKRLGRIQLTYEFDYTTANAHFTHIQTGTNAMITSGMNNPDGRCYAPKIVAEFQRDKAQDLINTYGHKIFCGVARGVTQNFYVLAKNEENTIYKLNLNLFDNEYMIITSDLSNNSIVLNEVNLNNERIYQVLHLTTTRSFYAFSKEKMYIYDEDFNFVEHVDLPFIDDNIENTVEQVYFGSKQNMFALITQNGVQYLINYDYLNKKELWKIRTDAMDYFSENVSCFGTDGEYLYINKKTTINSVESYYILTYKITDDGLELETFNQSRCMDKTSLIYTKEFPTKYFFIEVSDYVYEKNNYKEDITSNAQSSIFLSKSFPYITAAHKINMPGTKTKNDYFEGVFELKM